MRLDQKVAEMLPDLSRSSAAKLIASGKVKINGALAEKASRTVSENDKVTVSYQPAVTPEINLPVIYEDENCVVINKPVGVLTHSKGNFNPEATVATWLSSRLDKSWQLPAGEQNARLGIVHRLDRATSGVMICAKNEPTQKFLQKQFSSRKVKKTYIAVVPGSPEPLEALIDMPIERNPKKPATFRVGANGKPATTAYKVIRASANFSMLELKPATGRTHQLRVHLHQIGHTIVGDTFYGGRPAERLYLHAQSLEITLPGGERRIFISDLPPEFNKILDNDQATS